MKLRARRSVSDSAGGRGGSSSSSSSIRSPSFSSSSPPASGGGGVVSVGVVIGGNNDNDDDDGGKRAPSSSSSSSSLFLFPRSMVGTSIVLALLMLILLVSQLSSSSSSSSGTDAIQAASSSSAAAAAAASSSSSSNVAYKMREPLHPVGLTSPATNATLHVIFSTDCSSYQHWQSYLFFHAALKVQQPGYVTRIASGCGDEDMANERSWHEEHISSKMSDRFRIHFTPHFSGVRDEMTGEVKGDYKFFNKPFGLKHWMENDKLMGFEHDDDDAAANGSGGSGGSKSMTMRRPDDVIILTDPDFLLLRPLTDDFSDERETLVGNRRKGVYRKKKNHFVTHGNPYAQTYGLGTQWRKFDLETIAGHDSPARDVDQPDGGTYYPVGPPYLATAADMYRIANTWSEFAPRVHKEYPHLLAEMYAYCIAAAHLKLPHMLVDSLMVSSSGVGGEGWKLVKEMPARGICNFAAKPNHAFHPVPSVIHYCQRYAVDRYFWGKRKVPKDIFTCEHPLLVEPPLDIGSGKYLGVVPQGRPESERKEITAEKEKMEAFMVCALTGATNEAMAYFKTNHCEGGGNMAKTYDMWAGKDVKTQRREGRRL